ncbi:MAG: hypothetical protein ACI8X5_002427 [Planctomycetota bacterium]|jgi:hypothetical protein
MAKLLPTDAAPGQFFGYSVAISGEVAFIAASEDDHIGSGSGSAYIFSTITGQQIAKIVPSDLSPTDTFGQAIAMSGGLLLAGPPCSDVSSTSSAGRAYIFQTSFGAPYCFGDGFGAPCPCGASGNPGEGCINSTGTGALLTAAAQALVSNDTFTLTITGAPADKVGLLVPGNLQHANGFGVPMGDGLLCTTGQSARSHLQVTGSAGETTYSDFSGQSFGFDSYGPGASANYTFWYRDQANPCSGAGFNFTNAWRVVWGL